MLDEIRGYQRKIFNKNSFTYKRYFHNRISLNSNLTGIVGARGVGKTTFLIQYLKELEIPFGQKLYISADIINISSLFDVAEDFSKEEGKVLVIDEIHKYKDFEIELKKIYDILDLQVIFSGSSALQIDHAKADLSRRAITHHVYGLSFREFLELNLDITLPSYSLEEILKNHLDIAYELLEKFNLRLQFREYLKNGYYPFYFEDRENYLLKLNETINTVIEVDIPSIFPIDYSNISNLKKLVRLICESAPYTPNIKELLTKMNMGENYKGLYQFLDYLHQAKVLNVVRAQSKGDNIFTKPEKIYLNNTNLHFAYCNAFEMGTAREVFFASMLRENHALSILKKGDFLVDEKYIFEVGGKNKGFKQIKDLPNSFVVADDIEIGSGNKVPLWLFGFLY
ncbi:MAG: ATPase component BioM of energizing module of biotin ECF transporter [uncultured Sulfurovum sp.]|uniref:ATPase component BioM of energizing module of biotin ECF transporter n=1 Tax=uncultured Sulfurovum sp. TaxID=269237 RepID=A0A6S6S796_9BACT|nr:MAG: ATPase component BioM of energizing module of biotin ECF transporter [uncultured Sulfurovum sp.]